MTRPTWPTDDPQHPAFDAREGKRFRRIAAKIADSVMAARQLGVQLSSLDDEDHCPLGCVPDSPSCRPHYRYRSSLLGLSGEEHRAFARGFDGKPDNGIEPYWYRLGAAYRERYP